MAIPLTPQQPSGAKFPIFLVVLIIVAVLLAAVIGLMFLRPEVAAPTGLLDKFLPTGSVIRQVQQIDVNVEGVTARPVFRTLREIAPLPLRIPATGKSNPFL